MPTYRVEKSIVIDVPIDQVYASVRDFRKWAHWSPWLTAEPECKLVFAEDGKSYTWDGKIIGNSELVITAEEAPNSIHYRLSIFKPWKSVNTSRFEFANEGAGTKVSWSMEGTMPFHLFFSRG